MSIDLPNFAPEFHRKRIKTICGCNLSPNLWLPFVMEQMCLISIEVHLRFFFSFAAFMASALLLCSTSPRGWLTRMCRHGTEISAGTLWTYAYFEIFNPFNTTVDILLTTYFWFSGSVRIFLLFFVETRWMWRTDRLKQNKLLSTGRRIFNIMKSLPRVTTTSKSLSCISQESLQGKLNVLFPQISWFNTRKPIADMFYSTGIPICILLNLLLLLLQKWQLTWWHNKSTSALTVPGLMWPLSH